MADCPIDQFSFFDQLCNDSIDVHIIYCVIIYCVKGRKTEPLIPATSRAAKDERPNGFCDVHVNLGRKAVRSAAKRPRPPCLPGTPTGHERQSTTWTFAKRYNSCMPRRRESRVSSSLSKRSCGIATKWAPARVPGRDADGNP